MAEAKNKRYESVLIFHPELTKDKLNQEVEAVKQLLASNGATDLTCSHWGRRDLAYRAKKQKQGSYVALEYCAEPDNTTLITTLCAALRIKESVLKFQTHRCSDTRRKFKGNPKRVVKDEGSEDDMVFGFTDN
ncbi:MAG: 30S ribosomal protein S6 [Deltaproteobacteria bacterium]|nr:30S ribosomal protein S6 [Deltaproteobacteria bacterium]